MPQSLSKVYVHIVFSTKQREHILNEQVSPKLYRYLAGICNKMECRPIKIGGHTDHVHVLCMLSKKVTIIKLLEELKKSSSKWMKLQGDNFRLFYWQDGYGIFSVNPYEIEIAVEYIENQYEHHRVKTFQEEYRAFLKKYEVDYDERYVWD